MVRGGLLMPPVGPWFLTPSAVRQWADLRGIGSAQALGELIRICVDAAERKSPRRSASGLLVYRVRKPIDVQLMVADEDLADGELPQLVAVRRVQRP